MVATQWLVWIVPMAVTLDLMLGDPRWMPHPVRWLGLLLSRLEERARAFGATRVTGVASLAALLLVTGAGAAVLCSIPRLGPFLALYLAYAGLALGSLLHEGGKALAAIEHGTLAEGREAVAMLVSRDTTVLDQPGLRRALAETLAENFNDGFVAPLFWLVAGGPVALWLYKAVSTVDSMWGYRTERWANLGWAGAKLDDALAWLPARLCVALLWATAPLSGVRGAWPGMPRVASDARQMESPNAGWPMAAAAWLHRGRMGGPTVYFGTIKQKPILGPVDGEWDEPTLKMLMHHLRIAGLAGTFILWVASMLVR